MKLDILAIGAHPDDVEMSVGGIIAKHIALGKTVGIIDLTKGEMGTRGTPGIRAAEAQEGAKILGVKVREQLHLRDGFITNDEQSQLKVIAAIRKYQPDIVLANAIGDRHPDHRKASELVKDAAFLAGLRQIATTDNGAAQQAWRPKHVYHYIQDTFLNPSFVIDITGYIDIKMNAIAAYKSQFYNPNSKEPETILTTPEFFDGLKARSREYGRKIGTVYGEGLISSRAPGAASLFDLM